MTETFAIPGLKADAALLHEIEFAFSSWADHFKDRLREQGLPGLLREYEETIESAETQTCQHGSGMKSGEDWQFCCGISYEYDNDIAVRDALDIILAIAGKEAVDRTAREQLASLDNRLYALYQEEPERTGRWWRNGRPAAIRP